MSNIRSRSFRHLALFTGAPSRPLPRWRGAEGLWARAREAAARARKDASQLDVAAHQKRMVTQFVMPILTLATILFYIAHWTNDPWKKAMTLFGLLVAGANIWATSQDRVEWYRLSGQTNRGSQALEEFVSHGAEKAVFG